MKTVMICCGAGVATSTIALNQISQFLRQEGLDSQVRLVQGTVAEAQTRDDLDFVVSTSAVALNIPVVNALPLLTGIGKEQVFSKVKSLILAGR